VELFYTYEEAAAIPWNVQDRNGTTLDLSGATVDGIRIIRDATNDLIVTQTDGYTLDDVSPNFVLDTWAAATLAAVVTSLTTTVPAQSAIFKIIPDVTVSSATTALKASGKPYKVIFELPAT
jgi:hypothetical protein